MKKTAAFAVLTSCLSTLACSAEDPPVGSGGAGGLGGTGATSGSAGTAGTGGNGGGAGLGSGGSSGATAGVGGSSAGTAGSTSAGGTAAGGASGTGGGQAGGGMSGGGAAGGGAGGTSGDAGSSGTGGAGGDSAGASGTGAGNGGAGAGSGGTGGGGGNATPSPGCDSGMGRPAGGTVSTSTHYFTFPEIYDGQTPLPVLMGFHGCSSGNRGTNINDTEYIRLTRNTAFEDAYVVAVPISSSTGGCWSYNNDIGRIKAMYDDLVENYCVDTSRMFATGHSSGADLAGAIQNSQHTADAEYLGLKAIAPVAGVAHTIGTPIPVMYIQGTMDAERQNSDGANVVELFRTGNMCEDTYTPYTEVDGCQSKYNQAAVDPGCRLYDGCEHKTVWCRHNDGDYGGTMHGVPCFAMQAMFDFFESLD
jgi:polyhydroxybutyrate depolymerase